MDCFLVVYATKKYVKNGGVPPPRPPIYMEKTFLKIHLSIVPCLNELLNYKSLT